MHEEQKNNQERVSEWIGILNEMSRSQNFEETYEKASKIFDLAFPIRVDNPSAYRMIIPCVQLSQFEIGKICRVRPNYNGEVFSTKEQLSYNPNLKDVRLGRFNSAEQPMFYAAIPDGVSSQHYALTAIIETCKDVIDENCEVCERIITCGIWSIVKDFWVFNLCMSDVHSEKNSRAKQQNEIHWSELEKVSGGNHYQYIRELWRFLSDLACRKSDDKEGTYGILTALFDVLRKKTYYKIGGIQYASSMTDATGVNIALIPSVVENLKLKNAIMNRIRRPNKDSRNYNIGPCSPDVEVIDDRFIFPSIW